jgi:hypothetical protein
MRSPTPTQVVSRSTGCGRQPEAPTARWSASASAAGISRPQSPSAAGGRSIRSCSRSRRSCSQLARSPEAEALRLADRVELTTGLYRAGVDRSWLRTLRHRVSPGGLVGELALKIGRALRERPFTVAQIFVRPGWTTLDHSSSRCPERHRRDSMLAGDRDGRTPPGPGRSHVKQHG